MSQEKTQSKAKPEVLVIIKGGVPFVEACTKPVRVTIVDLDMPSETRIRIHEPDLQISANDMQKMVERLTPREPPEF